MIVDALFPAGLDANGSTFYSYGGYRAVGLEQERRFPIGICSKDSSFSIGNEEFGFVVHAHGSQ